MFFLFTRKLYLKWSKFLLFPLHRNDLYRNDRFPFRQHQQYHFQMSFYSYFEKGCWIKCMWQPRKVLWVILSSLFFNEIKVGSTATVIRNSVFTIFHITFRDCRVYIFSDNFSRNSCIQSILDVTNVITNDILYSNYSRKNLDNEIKISRTNLLSPLSLRYIEDPLFSQTAPHSLICILLQMAGERSEAIATIIEEAGGF